MIILKQGDRMYNGVNEYYKEKFGCKVYKLSLVGATTCPNRDGKVGFGGCSFCSKEGSGEFAENKCGSIEEQLKRAKKRVSAKIKDGKYVAYFQSYTNTYGDIDYLKNLFYEAIKPDYIVGIAIGTRPDCLSQETIKMLSEINKIKPVCVELGLQTIHDEIAENFNRCYKTSAFDDAVNRLKKENIEVVVHMIIGLPLETKEMIIQTARHIGKSGADGIKFHLLYVLKNTRLCEEYSKGLFKTLEIKEYVDVLEECIKVIPKTMIVHRLTGDPPKSELIAPLWLTDKKRVLNYINKRFKEDNLIQGSKYKAP